MAEPLWTSENIAAATGGKAIGPPFEVTGLSIDTRTLQPGDLFVALAGQRDGHDFLEAAFAAGAAGALISSLPLEGGGAGVGVHPPNSRNGTRVAPPETFHQRGAHTPIPALPPSRGKGTTSAVLVPDTLQALEALAAAARDRSSARRCAVTGSVGKTGVTQAIAAALKLAGRSHAPVKSFNNHIGVPLTLAALPRDAQFAVFELGMNHAGEIGPLSRLVQPHVAVVTTVGPVHVENFPDGEAGVARAKAEVFEGLMPGGVAVLNADDKWFDLLAEAARAAGAKVLSFGRGEHCDAQLVSSLPLEGGGTEGGGGSAADGGLAPASPTVALSPPSLPFPPPGGRVLVVKMHGRVLSFPIAQSGAHWGPNSLAVLLAVEALGAPVSAAIEALAQVAPLAGRGVVKHVPIAGGEITLVDESYNANPVSMRAAIDTLAQAPPRRLAVLTDMLELGPEAARHHAELAAPLEAADVAAAYLAGPSMRHLHDALPRGRRGVWAHDAAELAPAVLAAVRPGDTVMVKGSNGSRAGLIVKALLDASSHEARR